MITRYVLVDKQGREGDYEYQLADNAIADAGSDHAVIERHYVLDDSELIWTPSNEQVWP